VPTAACAPTAVFSTWPTTRTPNRCRLYKIQSTLGEIIKKKGKVDNDFMQYAMDTAWSKCTCCNRCGTYCPFGIDMGIMFGYLRGLCYSQGFVPWELKIGAGMHRIYNGPDGHHHRGLGGHLRVDGRGIRGGLSRPGNPRGQGRRGYHLHGQRPGAQTLPEDLAEAAILFHLAGENWTVPSQGWEETSLAMFAGDWAACKMQVESVYDAMDRLKPKRMVVTECGHAYRATVIEGPYWAGLEDGQTPVPSFHYVEWVAEALRTGKLKIDPAKKHQGAGDLPGFLQLRPKRRPQGRAREIMSYIAEDFRNERPNKEHNFCCGGGGGLNGIGPLPASSATRPQGQTGPDSGHRRQTGHRPLPQLLGCHPGPGRGLQDRHPLVLSQTAALPAKCCPAWRVRWN
jgi:ferredoxin